MKRFVFQQSVAGFVVAVLLSSTLARADDVWTLTTSDFKTTTVSISSIDATNVTVSTNGDTQTLPVSSIIQLSRGTTDETVKGLVLCVVGGEKLVGTPKKLDGQSLVWFTSGAGDISVPIEQTLGVLRDRTDKPDLSADRAEDAITLATGDAVHGIISDVTDKAFTVTPATGDPATVSIDTIASILFASPPGGRKADGAIPFSVHIAGGSVIGFKTVAVQNDKLAGEAVAGGSISLPMDQVTSIENTGGPLQWLSARTPMDSTYTPFIEGRFSPRMDRSVTGQPIRFHGITFARGIGVHSRTKLVYAIQPDDHSFRTQYAIDGDLPDANVDVRVWVDDKVVHELKGFRAGVLSPVIEADLSHAKTLTLEVDYGQGYDVQDRLNWIEPAILREQK